MLQRSPTQFGASTGVRPLILYNSDLSGGSAVSTAAAAGFGSGCQQSDRRRPPDQTHGRYWCGQIFAPAAHRRAAACLTRRFVSSQPTRRRAAASKINVSSQTPRRIGRNCTVRSTPLNTSQLCPSSQSKHLRKGFPRLLLSPFDSPR